MTDDTNVNTPTRMACRLRDSAMVSALRLGVTAGAAADEPAGGASSLKRQTRLLCGTAAAMNDANSGCGSNGRDFSSGWNCTPTNQGWSSYFTISGRIPSGDR